MADRAKRRRLNDDAKNVSGGPAEAEKIFPNAPSVAATAEDKSRWNGFCEIESEPAFFNVMLRDFGVKGVKVQEVVSLDDEFLAFLPRPIHGLIFLYRWREDDPEQQEATCPEGVWFANQTINHACATVALLNIVNNIEGAELGEHLHQFKEFTASFTPALRGDAIANFQFVKQIHNSFARKMDMLNSDLQLKNDATAKKTKKRRGSTPDDESENGFHFIAFVPAAGKVWKLDGLERQPQSLGEFKDDDWLELAKPFVLSRMAEYEQGQIEFSMLSLVRDPLSRLKSELTQKAKAVQRIHNFLEANRSGQASTGAVQLNGIAENGAPSLVEGKQEAGPIPHDMLRGLEVMSIPELETQRSNLVAEERSLRVALKEEERSVRMDEEHAASRRHDYGPAIHAWMKMLAKKKMVEPLLQGT